MVLSRWKARLEPATEDYQDELPLALAPRPDPEREKENGRADLAEMPEGETDSSIAEDNELNAEIAVTLLEECGLQAEWAQRRRGMCGNSEKEAGGLL